MFETSLRPKRSAAPFVIISCRPVVKNSLRCFLTIEQPSGMVIADIAVHQCQCAFSVAAAPVVLADCKEVLR